MARRLTTALLAALGLVGCGAHEYHVTEPAPLVLQVNLHPDEVGGLSSVNQQRPWLLPLCTPVQLTRVTDDEVEIYAPSLRRFFVYTFHRSMQDPLDLHLAKLFGPTCPDIGRLGPEDQAGIRAGMVRPGMTRKGVLLAIGYPPEHVTPDLRAERWTYWRTRFATFEVRFEGDRVAQVVEL